MAVTYMTAEGYKKLVDELNEMSAQISTFKPVLNEITDGDNSKLPGIVCGQLEMIACLSEYLQFRLCEAAAKLSRLDKLAA